MHRRLFISSTNSFGSLPIAISIYEENRQWFRNMHILYDMAYVCMYVCANRSVRVCAMCRENFNIGIFFACEFCFQDCVVLEFRPVGFSSCKDSSLIDFDSLWMVDDVLLICSSLWRGKSYVCIILYKHM